MSVILPLFLSVNILFLVTFTSPNTFISGTKFNSKIEKGKLAQLLSEYIQELTRIPELQKQATSNGQLQNGESGSFDTAGEIQNFQKSVSVSCTGDNAKT